jgi:LuxR family transcriptional regulator, maltose regulon positive regulatory protein
MMKFRLLATKFHFPLWRDGCVTRPRLLEHLNSGLAEFRKLTLISAPAGYGKTTLIVNWIHSMGSDSRVAWISLDEGDNELARFLGYWISAFCSVDDSLGQNTQSLLDLPQLPPLETILDELLNDLAGFEGRLVMVLDDFHTIHNQEIHKALEYFIEHQPAQVHLAITTREDPPLPLARMRARGQMTEIRARDLRFTLDEAQHFFTQSMHLELAAEIVDTLETRTEGWAAGLQLAALALQNLPNPQEFVRTFHGTHRYILDYLAEEVLRQQEAEIRNFLFQTAVLEKFNAPLCDAVTGRSDSQNLIAYLEQANLFIIPLDHERIWYRYHHLFADYLRTGLTKTEQALIHEKTTLWYEENDLVFEAVKHVFLSGNLEMAADVIERVIQKVSAWSSGEVATLVGWIDSLPIQLLQSRPALCVHSSRVWYLSGRIMLAEKFLDLADQSICENPTSIPDAENLQAISALYRGSLAVHRGDVQVAIERSTYALEKLPEGELYARARAAETLGLAYEVSGELEKAFHPLIQASDIAHSIGVLFMTVISRCEAALVQIAQGRLQLASETCQQAIQLAGDKQIPPLGFAWFVLAEIAWERNDLSSTEQYLIDGLKKSRQGGLTEEVHILMSLARLKRSTGNLAAALTAIEQAHSIVQNYGIPRLVMLSNAHRVRIQLANGRLDAVNQWVKQYQELRRSHPVEYARDYEDLTLARVYLANGDHEQAMEILSPLLQQAESAGRNRTCIESTILLSLAANAQTRTSTAIEWLEKALTLAEPEGFLRLFLDEGSVMAGLLPKVRHTTPVFVEQLLKAFPEPIQDTKINALLPANSRLAEPLSEQELRVIKLIIMGKSNQEIAEELFISVGTAKWHVHNILQKLDVSNRSQAIARARELGL